MTPAPRVSGRLVACLAAIAGSSLLVPVTPSTATTATTAAAAAAPTQHRPASVAPRAGDGPLLVAIDRLDSDTLRRGRPLVIHGTVTNTSPTRRLKVQAYAQMSSAPAENLTELSTLAGYGDDVGIGIPDLSPDEYAPLGAVRAGERRSFVITIPYRHLLISGEPGVYRLGIKVLSSAPDGTRDLTDAARANLLLPLLPTHAQRLTPVQAVTLLPLTAPVKRLTRGPFADDSLVSVLAAGGRLSNVVDWALAAAPQTVQVVVDPALLSAVTDMADGYRIAVHSATGPSVGGRGQAVAARWLAHFEQLDVQQQVMLLPWGSPVANSLVDSQVPGPVVAAVRASTDFAADRGVGSGVAGWLPAGSASSRALSVMRAAGATVEMVCAASLPGLQSGKPAPEPPPSRLDLVIDGGSVPTLVIAGTLAGRVTTTETTPLQFRQRLLAEATIRSIDGQTDRVAVTALPFSWDPGALGFGQDFASAFETPVIVAQSAIGAIDRTGIRYDGVVRPGAAASRPLAPAVLAAIRELRLTGGNLASILSPSPSAAQAYQRAFAMSGSAQWLTYPRAGVDLIGRLAAADRAALAKVTVTGPPFVAMSSDSGRFPLTVTNGLDKPVSVGLAVTPENPALSIGPLSTIVLPPGQRRDIQVVSTADGSGVTSVRARLATLTGQPFGTAWRFDVRATQIGVVIWVVMGVGGAILFGAAGYRIANRLRGQATPRRQTTP